MSTVDDQEMLDPSLSPMGNSALAYVREGWTVIALHGIREDGSCTCIEPGEKCPDNPGKHPRVKWKGRTQTTEAEVREWWGMWPNANIGAIAGLPGGFFVVDIDGNDGAEVLAVYEMGDDVLTDHAAEWLRQHPGAFPGEYEQSEQQCAYEWLSGHGALGATLTVVSGSGGRHLYFACPSDGDGPVPTKPRWLKGGQGGGVDIKGAKSYVVLPPSIHKSGNQYEWASDSFDENGALSKPAVPPMDVPLSNRFSEPRTLADRLRLHVEVPNGGSEKSSESVGGNVPMGVVHEGVGRDNAIFKRACQLWRFGHPKEAIEDAMQRENLLEMVPPLDPEIVTQKVNQACQPQY